MPGRSGPFLVAPGFERIKALILLSAGLPNGLPPHLDAVNFAPRCRIPTLMINGRNDPVYPPHTVEPLYRLLGAPESDKKLFLYDGGHMPDPTILYLKEAIDWLDHYLGPVGK